MIRNSDRAIKSADDREECRVVGYLTPFQFEQLRKAGKRTRTSISSLIRLAVDAYLETHNQAAQ